MTGSAIRNMVTVVLAVLGAAALIGVLYATNPPMLNTVLRDDIRPAPTYVNDRVLATDTAETETVPTFDTSRSGYRVDAIYSANCADYYIRFGGTAAAPSADVSDGTGSEHNPSALQFAQNDAFSIVSPTACKVSIAYYLVSYGGG